MLIAEQYLGHPKYLEIKCYISKYLQIKAKYEEILDILNYLLMSENVTRSIRRCCDGLSWLSTWLHLEPTKTQAARYSPEGFS